MNIKEQINELLNSFDGKLSLYAIDNYQNEIKMNEDQIVETASCIKLFILIEYYNQILNGEKRRDDLLEYDNKKDYISNGSGIIQYLENISMTSKNMAILMMIVSDNIATNKMIEYLGFNNINNTIKKLGFKHTRLISKKLDFSIYNKIGETTAKEYALAYKMILNNEILTKDCCKEIIEILSNQTKNQIITRYLPKDELLKKGRNNSFIKYIASKSGGLGDEGRNDIVVCRNDGGIISTSYGDYIISIFIYDFKDFYFYPDNTASIFGAKISKLIYDLFCKNNGALTIGNDLND